MGDECSVDEKGKQTHKDKSSTTCGHKFCQVTFCGTCQQKCAINCKNVICGRCMENSACLCADCGNKIERPGTDTFFNKKMCKDCVAKGNADC